MVGFSQRKYRIDGHTSRDTEAASDQSLMFLFLPILEKRIQLLNFLVFAFPCLAALSEMENNGSWISPEMLEEFSASYQDLYVSCAAVVAQK